LKKKKIPKNLKKKKIPKKLENPNNEKTQIKFEKAKIDEELKKDAAKWRSVKYTNKEKTQELQP